MPGGALAIVGVEFVCRTCEATTTIYLGVEEGDDGKYVDLNNGRVTHEWCSDCGQERTMVARPTLPDGYTPAQ